MSVNQNCQEERSTLASIIFVLASFVVIFAITIAGSYVAFEKAKQKQLQKKIQQQITDEHAETKTPTAQFHQGDSTHLNLEKQKPMHHVVSVSNATEENTSQSNTKKIDLNVHWYDKKVLIQFIKYLPKEIWKKKRCYFPFITHIIDQATDIAVIIKFYQISNNDIKCGNNNNNNTSGEELFFASLFFFVFYKIISCIWIYIVTGGKILDSLLQLIFDAKLYHALYINFTLNKQEPCNPQRYLQILEASIESFPQCVIQLYFLISEGSNANDSSIEIIYLSLLFSIWNISSKMISEDKVYFMQEWQSLDFQLKPFSLNVRYIGRFIFRMIDFVDRLLLLVLTWTVLGGVTVLIYICFEFMVILAFVVKTKR